MKDSTYFFTVLGISLFICLFMTALNYAINIYGLFKPEVPVEMSVFADERQSKYLLAHRYIPSHFDGVILGPSLSANLDPEPFSFGRFYNASIMGGRVTPLKTLMEKSLENNGYFEKALVCIHPYLTNHAENDPKMHEKNYWGALGSLNLYRTYLIAAVRQLELLPSKYPKNQYSPNGYNDFEIFHKADDVAAKIKEETEKLTEEDFAINPVARQELIELTQMLNEAGTQILFYYHPMPFEMYQQHQEKYDDYWQSILEILEPVKGQAKFYNFNQPGHFDFLKNYDNYIDHGHFSQEGQALFIQMLQSVLSRETT
ncbi:hypothetical protein [Negadavirga shengliensis]|uniref:SGNH/GDSL hydrolase family protein n=1 Tax=Negadavirga shengliensis TaxID=1389218 RepID=A0ABV9SX08_9BACT